MAMALAGRFPGTGFIHNSSKSFSTVTGGLFGLVIGLLVFTCGLAYGLYKCFCDSKTSNELCFMNELS